MNGRQIAAAALRKALKEARAEARSQERAKSRSKIKRLEGTIERLMNRKCGRCGFHVGDPALPDRGLPQKAIEKGWQGAKVTKGEAA